MVDTSGFGSIPRVESFLPDPAALREAVTRQAERMKEIQARQAELVGTAQSDDRLITANVGADGPKSLHLDPKAMRKPSMDLAEEIVETLRLAQADLQRQRDAIVEEMGADIPQVDLDTATAQVNEASDMLARGMTDMQAIFDRFQQQARG